MLGVQFVLAAAAFVAASNYCMRRSVDAGGTTKAYLMVQFFLMCFVAILLNPVRTGDYAWNVPMASFGMAGGVVLALMMVALGKSLETGPAGLSFAMLSAATVMPMVVMVMFFGAAFGYGYTLSNGIGSLCVVLGLLWAGWETFRSKDAWKWACFATAAFCLHVVFLVFMQWRALLMNFPGREGLFFSFSFQDSKSQWFMPMIFLAAALLQTLFYVVTERRRPTRSELLFGFLGGVANGVGTFFLIRATEVSSPLEHALIFPLFSVAIIVLCNLWGQYLYKEKVNWKANAFCIGGLVIGTLDWSVFA